MAWRGVGKSGSPLARLMTSMPRARISRAVCAMAALAETFTCASLWASPGMSLQPGAEALDAGAGFLQRLIAGGVADAEIARIHEGGAMHAGHALFLQQGEAEILVRLDPLAALAGLADAALHAGEDVEGAFRLLAADARGGVQHLHHHVAAALVGHAHHVDG